MGSEKKVENLSLLFRVKKKCLKNALFSPQREKERSFWKSFFFWTKKTILLFREFFRKESFVSLFSLRTDEEETPRKRERLFKEGKINGTMALSSTSAICAGKTAALSRTQQNRPMSKRHHRHRLSLGVKAVQTPRKPAETVTTPPASNEDEKEAYPFEKQYKDCASCVRFARRRRSCTIDIVSIFDEGERPKRIKSKSYPRRETISFLKP